MFIIRLIKEWRYHRQMKRLMDEEEVMWMYEQFCRKRRKALNGHAVAFIENQNIRHIEFEKWCKDNFSIKRETKDDTTKKIYIDNYILKKILLTASFIIFICLTSISQEETQISLLNMNYEKLSASVQKKVSSLESKIIAKSIKTLQRLQKQEEKIYKKQLNTKDSLVVKEKLAEIQNKYKALSDKLKSPVTAISKNSKQYIPYLDTLKTVFAFLEKNESISNIKDIVAKVESFEGKMQQAEEIKKFIRERREQLKRQLEQLELVKQLTQFNKEVFYYAEQLKEYKEILSDPKKIERKAFELLSKTKAFQNFFRKNSMLALLFRMSGADPNDPAYLASLSGLQTRSQVNNLIQQQISAGGPNAMNQFRQNLQQAQTQLQQLKDKVLKSGGSSSNDDIPNFKPNSQKTKSFLKRLEFGTNIQSQKTNGLFPVTTDFGLSLGYKPNDKSVIGIGASYKLGWGQNIRNIVISHQGVGIRSFVDYKLKGSFWLSGGYEMNYQSEFNRIVQLQDMNAWQKSGLLGVSKVISVKSKFFKKTKLQLLWDFLSYEQRPRTQPVIFRVGYNIKTN